MPHLNGFEVLQRLDPKRFPMVIFVTAYEQYAVKAFEYHALDYLLKPFRRERFREAIERARIEIASIRRGQQFKRFRALLEHWNPAPSAGDHKRSQSQYLQRLFIRSAKASLSLEINQIEWIKSLDHFVELHSRGKSFMLYSSIGALEKKLDPSDFLRVHRTTIINVSAIREFRLEDGGACLVAMSDGTLHRVSRNRRQFLQERLSQL